MANAQEEQLRAFAAMVASRVRSEVRFVGAVAKKKLIDLDRHKSLCFHADDFPRTARYFGTNSEKFDICF